MTTGPSTLVPFLKALFAVIVWGASFIATKVALQEVSPATVVWLRFMIGLPVLGAFVVARNELRVISRNETAYFTLLGFLGITFHQWLQSNGLITSQATTTAWIITTIPVFIALLGRFVLKEPMGWIRRAGILVAAAGVLIVVSRGDVQSLLALQIGVIGDFLVLLSAPNWALFSILSRRGLQKHSASTMMFYVMGAGCVFNSIMFFTGGRQTELSALTVNGWTAIIFLGIFCSGVAYIYWYDALKVIEASRVGALLYIEPLVAVMVAAVVLSEPIQTASLLGGAVILFGVWLVNHPTVVEETPD